MRNRKYLIGALVGVLGVFAFSGVASAVPTSQTLQTTLAPKKQDKKKFGAVSLHNIISTKFDNFATSQSPKTTTFSIDPNVKFVNGNIPVCPLSAIQGKFTAQSQAACPSSITGGGSVEVNGGQVGGTVTFFSGGPKTIYVQTDIGPGATSLTIIGTIAGHSLVFSNIPNTPGLVLSKFDTTFKKRKSGKKTVKVHGKKKKRPVFYVMARCKKKRWKTSESTNFYSGETLSASSSEKCKQKGSKKKHKK
ncbi:MAG: hypothetical protein WB771_10250 [Solirubrobacterales bacterium]